MSTTTEQAGQDFLAVACVVDTSIAVASEWPRILTEYISPLLRRLNELHPAHQFRLAFITYGAADTRPSPLVSNMFFSPLSLATKELREEPSKLGIGQTSCRGTRGLSALEGLVAAIEHFDTLMMYGIPINPSSPQKENRTFVSHLIHIAACPPDNTQRPQCNTLQHLDSVTWDTLATELRKRKIHLSLISLRKVQQFQELQSAVAGNGIQSAWFNVQPSHVIALSGFPAPLKAVMKRPTESSQSDRNPEAKRQRVTSGDPSQKSLSGSPALSAAPKPTRPPSAQPPHPQVPSITSPSQSTGAQISPFTHPPQVNPQHAIPQSTAVPTTSQPNPPQQSLPNSAAIVERLKQLLKQLELDIKNIDMRIGAAQQQGQATAVAELQRERAEKLHQGMSIGQHLRNQVQAMQATFSRQAVTPLAANADATRSGQSATQGDLGASPSTLTTLGIPGSQGERSASGGVEEQKLQMSPAQALAQFWQSRGGSVNGANIHSVGPNQPQAMTPELAAQMKKLIDKTGIRPTSFGLVPQSASSSTSQEANMNSSATNSQPNILPVWEGTFSWMVPQGNGQGPIDVQAHVRGFADPRSSANLLAHTWPKNMALTFCKEPLKDPAEIVNWIKCHQPLLMVHLLSPRANDPASNDAQSFQSLTKLMNERHIYAYAGWKLPNGNLSNNIVIFPSGKSFKGAVFPETGLPDLPGSGNALEPIKPGGGSHTPRDLSHLPPALLTQLRALDPAKREQFLKQYAMRVQMQMQQQQQQQLQSQSTQVLSAQDSTLAKANTNVMAPASGNMSMALPLTAPNVSRPTGGIMYGNGGGTVNMEMLQSFMQRNAAASQNTNPG
ncbi:hypothetical protein F5J12DRAFT_810524 [Pisolithus orientalis]|uniref:uncharacterized protein n=1 Tax=Pisolithus orientalis TaxID=936130 RepID=UPI0022259319|nr:uncharacterized protein F5J12DRAFT_810524 [Pisolithus orientalis]KAI6025813.1 hypothetical protein F5J12DRAFT_810524 [Pisolithus orientalis]